MGHERNNVIGTTGGLPSREGGWEGQQRDRGRHWGERLDGGEGALHDLPADGGEERAGGGGGGVSEGDAEDRDSEPIGGQDGKDDVSGAVGGPALAEASVGGDGAGGVQV